MFAVLAFLLLLVAPRAALAHAVPVARDPDASATVSEAPRDLAIRFSERVEPRASSLELLDASGRRVDTGAPRVEPADPWLYRLALPALEPGAYTVAWRVLSADDGHVTEGAYAFSVGAAAAPSPGSRLAGDTPPLVGVGRWLRMIGALTALGVLVGPLVFGPGPVPGWLVPGAVATMVGGELAEFGARVGQLAAGPGVGGAVAALLTTGVGRAAGLRLALTALLAGILGPAARAATPRTWLRYAGIAGALLVVLAGGLVTHSAAVTVHPELALGAEALHLVGVALWCAGLGYFATLFWVSLGTRAPAMRAPAALARAIPAFSVLATVAVGSLTLSGLYLARLHLASPDELLTTPYGRMLTAKLAAAAAMLALGAYHQLRVSPRVATAGAGPADPGDAIARGCRRTLRIEAGLGAVTLLLAAFLATTSPPAPSSSPSPPAAFRHEREIDGARVILEVASVQPGPTTIRVTATDRGGRPLADTTAALVRLLPPGGAAGPVTLTLTRAAPGSFVSTDALLGLTGTWSGLLVLQRAGAYDVRDEFELSVATAPSGHPHGHAPASPARGPAAPLDRPMALAALAIAGATTVLVLRSRRALGRATFPDPWPQPDARLERR